MIESKSDLIKYLEMDRIALDRQGKRVKLFGDEIWKFEIILRKHEYYTNCSKNAFQKLLKKYYGFEHYRMGLRLGFEIPCNVLRGGATHQHCGLIIINQNAQIGEWCDIHQAVNNGQNIEHGSVPVIGNNVWIGPGVKIFGEIEIGDNVMIDAGSVVNKSFKNGNCRIAGNPAKVISNEPNVYEEFE